MISIIIPTKNEEKLLPRLLKDISKQTFKDYEIIVADADSDDKTVDIAKEYNCRIVEGGMPGPGRNRGAEAARGEYLIFFDADITIGRNFISKAFEEFQTRYLDVAACFLFPDQDSDKDHKVLFDFYNAYMNYSQYFNPGALGTFMMSTRRMFERLGGFDENIKLGEDYDYIKRASKLAKFRFLKSVSAKFSTRRIDKEGVLKYLTRNLSSEIYRFFIGEITDDVFEYEFGDYDSPRSGASEDNPDGKKKVKQIANSIREIIRREKEKKSLKKQR